MKMDLIAWYSIFLGVQDPAKHLEVIEDATNNLDDLRAIASTHKYDRMLYASDDTTIFYTAQLIGSAKKIIALFDPICEDFLGISSDQQKAIVREMPNLLVSYSLLLYKQFGYEAVAEDYVAHHSIDPSRLEVPAQVLEDLADDMSRVMDTLRLILAIFKMFNTYFAEYQVSSDEDLEDVINMLEEAGLGTEAIATMSQSQVEEFLRGPF